MTSGFCLIFFSLLYFIYCTGAGKSICFQIPPLITGKIAVVLTPTISLMNDQCLKLNSKGIPATFLGSGQMDKDTDSKVREGEFKVVYITPEKFFDDNGAASASFSNMLFEG